MALALANRVETVFGNQRIVRGTIAFDSAYARGGESLTARDLALLKLDLLLVSPKNGFVFEYDYTNSLLLALQASLGPSIVALTNPATTTTGTVKETLATYTLKGGVLGTNLMGIRLKAYANCAGNANNKTLGIDFGATTVASTGAVANNAGNAFVEATILRTGAATQEAGGNALSVTTAAVTRSAPGETLSGDVAVTVFGTTPTAAGDITLRQLIVELLTPPGTGAVGTEVPTIVDLSGLTGVRYMAVGI